MLKQVFLLSLFVFPVLAGLVWTLPTFGLIETKPLFFDGKVAVASHDGNIYCMNQQIGTVTWRTDVKEKINELEMGSGFVVGASSTRIVVLDKNGNLIRAMNESVVYGIAAAENIYVATNNGVKAYGYDGTLKWTLAQANKPLTDLLLTNDGMIVFGAGDDLVVAALNGSEKQRVKVGNFWKSKPAYQSGIVFIGSNDAKMYAVDLGKNKIIWSFDTSGWVMSDPVYSRGTVYFGDNSGNVYALNANTGAMIWKRKTAEAVQGNMEIASLGGKEVLIFGNNDNKAYMLDARTGNVVVAFSARGWVRNPSFNSGMLFFGSSDSFLYAYVVDRGCTIDSPASGENVGYKTVDMNGRVFSQYTGAAVFIRVNNGSWQPASVSGNDWSFKLDPNDYDFGNVFVECKVGDRMGEETKSFSYAVLFRNQNAPRDRITANAPASAVEKKEFAVRAYDENGAPMNDFVVLAGGKTYYGKNGSVVLKLDEPKTYTIFVQKTGYEDAKLTVVVTYDWAVVVSSVLAAIMVIAVAFYLFIYKRR